MKKQFWSIILAVTFMAMPLYAQENEYEFTNRTSETLQYFKNQNIKALEGDTQPMDIDVLTSEKYFDLIKQVSNKLTEDIMIDIPYEDERGKFNIIGALFILTGEDAETEDPSKACYDATHEKLKSAMDKTSDLYFIGNVRKTNNKGGITYYCAPFFGFKTVEKTADLAVAPVDMTILDEKDWGILKSLSDMGGDRVDDYRKYLDNIDPKFSDSDNAKKVIGFIKSFEMEVKGNNVNNLKNDRYIRSELKDIAAKIAAEFPDTLSWFEDDTLVVPQKKVLSINDMSKSFKGLLSSASPLNNNLINDDINEAMQDLISQYAEAEEMTAGSRDRKTYVMLKAGVDKIDRVKFFAAHTDERPLGFNEGEVECFERVQQARDGSEYLESLLNSPIKAFGAAMYSRVQGTLDDGGTLKNFCGVALLMDDKPQEKVHVPTDMVILEEEPPQITGSTYTVRLETFGEKKIAVIKAVRDLMGLGLKEAKDKVDNVPTEFNFDSLETATELVTALRSAGAVVRDPTPSETSEPMQEESAEKEVSEVMFPAQEYSLNPDARDESAFCYEQVVVENKFTKRFLNSCMWENWEEKPEMVAKAANAEQSCRDEYDASKKSHEQIEFQECLSMNMADQ